MIETNNGRVIVVSNRLPYTLRRAGDAWTIHVGENESRARFRLPGPDEMCALLSQFAAVGKVSASKQTA